MPKSGADIHGPAAALVSAPSRSERIGTAGWTVPAALRERLDGAGTQLARYAQRFNCVEINSSFYRVHRPATYARWAASVPAAFSFALKLPKEITHVRRCVDCHEQLARFVDDTAALGAKRGVILVQLPPSFVYDDVRIGRFFELVRRRYAGFVVCEPRHPSWFTERADTALRLHHVGRVAADPAIAASGAQPGGSRDILYYRQHGSPRMYYSRYDDSSIGALARALDGAPATERWCIFDNTAAGAALENAFDLQDAVQTNGRAASEPCDSPPQ